MSKAFGGSRFVLPTDFSSFVLPCKAADDIAIGDLLYFQASDSSVRPVDVYVGSGTALTDRLALKPLFAGVALEARIAAQLTTGYPAFPVTGIRVANELIYEATVASATYNEGDLMGFVSAAGGIAGDISPQTLVKVNNINEAIGYVWGRYAAATTLVRVRLFGRLTGWTNSALTPSGSSGFALYAASAAITQKTGLVVLTKAGVGAMTLAAPTAGADDNKTLVITSDTANAHTVTCPAGVFKNGGAAVTIFTFTGTTSGGGLTLVAYNATWKVLSATGGAFS